MKIPLVILCLFSLNIYAQEISIADNSTSVVVNENYKISILPYSCGTIMMIELNNINTGNVIVELFSFSGKCLQKSIIHQGSQYTFFNMSELESDEYILRIQTPMVIKFNRIMMAKY